MTPPTSPSQSQSAETPPIRERVTIELHGRAATGFELPADAVASLGAGKRPPVRVTLRSYTYRTSVGSRGGRHLVSVSAEHRSAAGVKAGDEVDVLVELDTAPREVAVPDDLAAAFAAAPAALTAFDKLSYSQQQRHVMLIEDAKTPETRQRRVAKAVSDLGSSSPA